MTRFTKKYWEKYAQLSLEFYFKKHIDKFAHLDEPDFQNNINDIGFEVVRAVLKEDLMSDKLMNKVHDTNYSKDDICEILGQNEDGTVRNERKNKYWEFFKADWFVMNNGALCTSKIHPCEKVENEQYINLISNEIDKKLKKINEQDHYKIFKTNCLYVFVKVLPITEIVDLIKLKHKDYTRTFNTYFFNSSTVIFILECDKNYKLTQYNYSYDEQCRFKTKALKYEKALLKR